MVVGTISLAFVPPPFVGVKVKGVLEHIVAVVFEIRGVGFTVTITVKP